MGKALKWTVTKERSWKPAVGDHERRRCKCYHCLGLSANNVVTCEGIKARHELWRRQVGRIAAAVASTMSYYKGRPDGTEKVVQDNNDDSNSTTAKTFRMPRSLCSLTGARFMLRVG
jgi:hypothetical protein